MKLTPAQLEAFDRDGYLFFPACSRPDEIKVLLDEVPRALRPGPPPPRERAREDRRRGAHQLRGAPYSAPFAAIGAPPAHGRPVRQVFGEDVYMHQFKINGKQAFDATSGSAPGLRHLAQRRPDARGARHERGHLLDEVNDFNGPLMFIPGSTKLGVLDAQHRHQHDQLSALVITKRTITSWSSAAASSRPRAAGLDDPFPRLPGARLDLEPLALEPVSVYLSLCAVRTTSAASSGRLHCAPGFAPIECLPDDCLLKNTTWRFT